MSVSDVISSDATEATPAPSQITEALRARRAAGSAGLIPYICAGFPTAEASFELLIGAADAGADVIELGIPFSDPLADGPTIQRATFEALERGMSVRGALELLRRFRQKRDTPVVLFTYLNPVHHFGLEAFVREAREAGAQGILLTDLPAGADPKLEALVSDGGLDLIRLLAPTTSQARIPEVAKGGGGFIYYISRTGVTGARTELRTEIAAELDVIRSLVSLPVAVGFGISSPEQAAAMAGVADGVIVGSALVDRVEHEGVAAGVQFLKDLRQAMDQRANGAAL